MEKTRINELIKQTAGIYQSSGVELRKLILKTNTIEVMRDHFLPLHKDQEGYDLHQQIVDEYETIVNKQESIKKIMPYITMQGITLLLVSSFSLFFIGMNAMVNEILFLMGIFTLILTLTFVMTLQSIILKTTEVEYFVIKLFKRKKNKTL